MKKKRKLFHIADCVIILLLSVFILLDTFVISRSYVTVSAHSADAAEQTETETESGNSSSSAAAAVTASTYEDDNISITLTEYEVDGTEIYVADVQVSSIEYLYSAFANDTYGKNVTAKTSTIAEANNAILAINGDYYGARNKGYVLRNGVLYRESSSSSSQEDLVLNADGSFSVIKEGETSAQSLEDSGALQVWSFGPALIENGEISVSVEDEVGRAKSSNPRTAICEIEPLHYLFVVSDGRTDEAEGLSLYELAQFLNTLGVKTAYNLDGGGSSTMYFNGEIINNPTTTGNSTKERSVSDVICIGY